MRVYQLAKELGLPSKVVVSACGEVGVEVKNHMSSISEEQAEVLRRHLAEARPPAEAEKTTTKKRAAVKKTPAKKKTTRKKAVKKKAAKKKTTKKEAGKGAKKAPRKRAQKKTAEEKETTSEAAPGSAEAAAAAAALADQERQAGLDSIIRMEEETREERQARRVTLAPSVQELLRRYAPEQERQRAIRRRRRRPRRAPRRAAPKRPVTIQRRRQITLDYPVTVKALSSAIGVKANAIIGKLLENGVMANINQVLDPEVAKAIALEYGVSVEVRTERDLERELIETRPGDKPEQLRPRAPVVALLGHVDHGKTSLLDAIRKTRVTESESGGITQHIGAYRVSVNRDGGAVTFLDTPGHEAFTAMRARGAHCTDIVVLVVAADDGVMPQTIEAINHARAAGVPILVALNKMDKPDANPDRVKRDLANLDLVPEEWGGDTIFVETSAVTGQGLDDLVEMLSLQAEMMELKANPDKPASGVVLEAELTQGQGVVATLLVQEGTLHTGEVLLCGPGFGRIRSIVDDQGRPLQEAGPSTPVGVTGLSEAPEAGDRFHVVADLATAKAIAEARQRRIRQISASERHRVTLENFFSRIAQGETKELRVVLKADVKGSLEVLRDALNKLSTEEARVKIIHMGVGAITQSDIDLADASDAIVIGFHVAPEEQARQSAVERGVDVRLYQVIYNVTEEVQAALEGLLEPAEQEVVTGHAEVRQLFRISRLGTIAGCYVTDGTIARTSRLRVLRGGEVIHTGACASLKRFKDDQREVREGFECGIRVEGFDDFQVGDVIEAFTVEKVPRRLGKPV